MSDAMSHVKSDGRQEIKQTKQDEQNRPKYMLAILRRRKQESLIIRLLRERNCYADSSAVRQRVSNDGKSGGTKRQRALRRMIASVGPTVSFC